MSQAIEGGHVVEQGDLPPFEKLVLCFWRQYPPPEQWLPARCMPDGDDGEVFWEIFVTNGWAEVWPPDLWFELPIVAGMDVGGANDQ